MTTVDLSDCACRHCAERRGRAIVQAAVQSAQGAADLVLATEIAETPLVTLEALTAMLDGAADPVEWRKSLAFALVASFGGDEQQIQSFVRAATLAFAMVAVEATEEKVG
jgi:hypothetical protein